MGLQLCGGVEGDQPDVLLPASWGEREEERGSVGFPPSAPGGRVEGSPERAPSVLASSVLKTSVDHVEALNCSDEKPRLSLWAARDWCWQCRDRVLLTESSSVEGLLLGGDSGETWHAPEKPLLLQRPAVSCG